MMETTISGEGCNCPYCGKKIAVTISHSLPEDRDRLGEIDIKKGE